MNTIEFGDCRDTMRAWSAQGVRAQMCVTSPPYFGLRDYGQAGQLGLEQTPEQYIAAMVEVFWCVRDVLADDGTLWLNIGDSYASRPNGPKASPYTNLHGEGAAKYRDQHAQRSAGAPEGLKHKDLIGIPLDAGLRTPVRWLVSAPGHHLAQAEPDARERDGPLHEGA